MRVCSSKLGEPTAPPQGSQGVGFRFLAVTSCLGSGFINVALTALRSIHRMDPRCDMAARTINEHLQRNRIQGSKETGSPRPRGPQARFQGTSRDKEQRPK